ncbi:hypothetical protein WA026_011462 [Henosepilachna vigintioctopunctata]|uniref:trypsin n=1 Tax=Henosepilachna vigintioctopunctata TaxID=420089 RepID=A0AAW1TJL6_9CUCU
MILLVNILVITVILSEQLCDVSSGRIYGGYYVNIENFPFAVSIGARESLNCGGVIISPRFILTAAHCINYENETYILAGTDDRKEGGTLVNVEDVTIHPEYATGGVDLALLKLEKPLHYSAHIRNVALPSYSKTIDVENGTVCGWGYPGNTYDDPTLLKAVDLNIDISCESESLFCVKHSDQIQNACKGDSGGPFVNNDVLYGIVSYAQILYNYCPVPGTAVKMVKIPYHINWIKENANII